jgi:hypothetical protein
MCKPGGILPNNLAPGSVITVQTGELFLLTRSFATAIKQAILLTAHSRLIASCLIHERAPMTLFRAQSVSRHVFPEGRFEQVSPA